MSHMSTLVPLSGQTDHQNGAQNQENPCSTENVIFATPPTPNHGFNHPKHFKNSSDFVQNLTWNQVAHKIPNVSHSRPTGKEIVTTNGETGDPQWVQKRTGNSLNSIHGPPYSNLLPRCPTVVLSGSQMMSTGPKKMPKCSKMKPQLCKK